VKTEIDVGTQGWQDLEMNNFPKARAGERLDVIKFVADLRKSGKDLILEKVISR
jgi:hypothetical protein